MPASCIWSHRAFVSAADSTRGRPVPPPPLQIRRPPLLLYDVAVSADLLAHGLEHAHRLSARHALRAQPRHAPLIIHSSTLEPEPDGRAERLAPAANPRRVGPSRADVLANGDLEQFWAVLRVHPASWCGVGRHSTSGGSHLSCHAPALRLHARQAWVCRHLDHQFRVVGLDDVR